MNKKFIILLSSVLFLLIQPQIEAQTQSAVNGKTGPVKTKVAIIPISCAVESDQYLTVSSKTVATTLDLVLRMSGLYDVIIDNADISENMAGYCEKSGIPNLIYGKSYYTDSGEIVFELSVYNMEKGKETITKKETAATVLDVFDTADTLALSLAESFSGMKMTFGKVKLISIGDKGAFRVRIGESVTVPESELMERVLTGKRDIEIVQDRMFGPYTVVTWPIEIKENATEDVVFFIPGFTDKEGELIRKKEAEIEKNLGSFFKKSGREKALELYNELIEKDLALTSYSSSAADKKQELIDKRDELAALLK